jgi:hypothetical protein
LGCFKKKSESKIRQSTSFQNPERTNSFEERTSHNIFKKYGLWPVSFFKNSGEQGLNKYTRTYRIFDYLRTEAMKPNNRFDNR